MFWGTFDYYRTFIRLLCLKGKPDGLVNGFSYSWIK